MSTEGKRTALDAWRLANGVVLQWFEEDPKNPAMFPAEWIAKKSIGGKYGALHVSGHGKTPLEACHALAKRYPLEMPPGEEPVPEWMQ